MRPGASHARLGALAECPGACYGGAPLNDADKNVDKFTVDPALLRGAEPLISLGLCEVRLQADSRWPWLVLIPRRPGAREVEHLSPADRITLIEETIAAGRAVRAMGAALGRPIAKLNIGALGNVTPQLHVHVVGRREDDAAWPAPVWGVGEPITYDPVAFERAHAAALAMFKGWSRDH